MRPDFSPAREKKPAGLLASSVGEKSSHEAGSFAGRDKKQAGIFWDFHFARREKIGHQHICHDVVRKNQATGRVEKSFENMTSYENPVMRPDFSPAREKNRISRQRDDTAGFFRPKTGRLFFDPTRKP